MILFLSSIAGCIVLWELVLKPIPKRCIDDVVGDGICDDRQNVAQCNYDDGDCCLIPRILMFCEDCKCYLSKC
jgi:hypothetical protein